MKKYYLLIIALLSIQSLVATSVDTFYRSQDYELSQDLKKIIEEKKIVEQAKEYFDSISKRDRPAYYVFASVDLPGYIIKRGVDRLYGHAWCKHRLSTTDMSVAQLPKKYSIQGDLILAQKIPYAFIPDTSVCNLSVKLPTRLTLEQMVTICNTTMVCAFHDSKPENYALDAAGNVYLIDTQVAEICIPNHLNEIRNDLARRDYGMRGLRKLYNITSWDERAETAALEYLQERRKTEQKEYDALKIKYCSSQKAQE